MRYAIGVESQEAGPAVAHVLDLPGCMGRGATPQAALERLFQAIPAYWDWLRGHGMAAPPLEQFGPVTLGVVDLVWGSAPQAAQDPGALFTPELEPCTPEQIALCLTRLDYSRADLHTWLQDQPPEAWTLPREGGSLADRVQAMAVAEHWFAGRLGALPAPPPLDPPLDGLAATRALVVQRLRGLGGEECATVYIVDGERWTARKVLRRLLEHECEQVAQIGLLLGANAADSAAGDTWG